MYLNTESNRGVKLPLIEQQKIIGKKKQNKPTATKTKEHFMLNYSKAERIV